MPLNLLPLSTHLRRPQRLLRAAICVTVGFFGLVKPIESVGEDNLAGATKAVAPIQTDESDWPWWRGLTHDGIATPEQKPPIHWGEDKDKQKNIVWSVPVPGRSHGSPIVVGKHVLLTAADHDRDLQVVLCFDRKTGKQLWEAVAHTSGLKVKNNEKSTMASASPACDGLRIFVNFLNDDSVYMTALDRQGKKLWQTKVSAYVNHQGFGSSPLLYQDLVIGVADNKGGGAIVAMNRESGEIVWKRDRPAKPNYPSPVILNVAGKDQLFLTGCDLVTSLNPLTGETIWECEGATTECVTTTVTDGTHIFTSGGYPKNHVSAVVADGSSKIAWENSTRSYVPSLLAKNGYLFAVMDAGVAICWNSVTGEEIWKSRLGGDFTSSPVMVGELIYATNENGKTFIFKASSENFELIATNQLGTSTFATPAICGGRIYTRVTKEVDGNRQEWLYCLGE